MQQEAVFKQKLQDLWKLHHEGISSKTQNHTLSEYISIAFVARAEFERRQQSLILAAEFLASQRARHACINTYPKALGLYKNTARRECELKANKMSVSVPIADKDRTQTVFDFIDGSLQGEADRKTLTGRYRLLKSDDHRLVGCIIKTWMLMLQGKSVEAQQLAMKQDPSSILIAIIDPLKLKQILDTMSRAEITFILNAIRTFLGKKLSSAWLSTKQSLIDSILVMITACKDLMKTESRDNVKKALRSLNVTDPMKQVISSIAADDMTSLLPWRSSQRGGSFQSFVHGLGLLCLSILCIVPIVPLVVIFTPYLLVPEASKIGSVDPFGDYINATFNMLSRNTNTFMKGVLNSAWAWVMLQYQLIATFSPGRALTRGVGVGAVKSMEKLQQVASTAKITDQADLMAHSLAKNLGLVLQAPETRDRILEIINDPETRETLRQSMAEVRPRLFGR